MNILDLKRKLLPMSGLYGGGGTSATSTQTSGLPEWALPYAQDTLAKQSALSDVAYQPYGGNRIQGFTPMQETARQNAAGMGTSDITGQVAQRGLNQQMFGADQAAQYMNPYQQNVVDIQKREAQRQSGIQGTQQASQATLSGALGGSRDAIMRAERERNLGQQMNDIQAVGSNAAYTNAQNQFNADQNRGLQGLQVAGTAAGQQFQQGMDVNKLQSAYGAQQQAMGQQGLNQAYQDFLDQKAYPQTQLSNMANMMRGLPIQQQTTTGTPGSPSNFQMLGGLGQIGMGLSGFFADGGAVSSYADGGSVDSQGNIESIVHKLSDPQLAQAEQSAKARGDALEMQVIAMEKAARVSMQHGIAAAPVNMDQILPSQESMARGGIVAFDEGGDVGEEEAQNYMSRAKPEEDDAEATGGIGNPDAVKSLLAGQQGSISALQGMNYKTQTPEERLAEFKANRALLMEGVDTSDRDTARADIKRMQEEGATDLKRGRSLAFIQSGAAMLEGNDPWRAVGKSASTFSEAYGSAIKANQAKNQALQNMKINLAESQRKEQMGLNREAVALQDQARKDRDAAQKFEVDRLRSMGILQGNAARAARVPAVKPPTPPKVAEATLQATVDARMAKEKPLAGETADQQRARLTAEVGPKILALLGTRIGSMVSEAGPGKREDVQAAQNIQRNTAIENAIEKKNRALVLDPTYRKADAAGKAKMRDDAEAKVRSEYFAAKAPTTAAPGKPLPAAQIPAGSTYGKVVPGKGTEVLQNGKVIGYAN